MDSFLKTKIFYSLGVFFFYSIGIFFILWKQLGAQEKNQLLLK